MKKIGLLLIDVQKGFTDPYWGERNNPHAEENIAALLASFRQKQYPIMHVQHLSDNIASPLHPGQLGAEFMTFATPIHGERIIQKNVNSAFIGTQLENILKSKDIDTLVIAGISTDHCVSTTTRMAANLGFRAFVASDATFTFSRKGFDQTLYAADMIHTCALASLHEEFATVATTQDIIETVVR